MKLFIPLCIALLAVTISCTLISKKQSDYTMTILFDVTDAEIQKPNVRNVFQRYYTDPFASYRVRIATISNTKVAEEYEFNLPSANPLLVNEFVRVEQIDSFQQSIQSKIDVIARQTQGKSQSYIAQKVIAEMHHLADQKQTDARLFIYSNLFENAQFNSYAGVNKALLEKDPEQVIEQIQGNEIVPNNSTIKIYLIYQPQTYQEGIQWDAWVAVYRKLFPQNEITVMANL